MKTKIGFILLLVFLQVNNLFSQKIEMPKLVVGIVIDQMRYDYLYRFNSYFGKNGFNRLMNDGTNFTFAHFNYVPTYTAPGHSSIYTGTTPFYHGIIANDWYDKTKRKMIYCVNDTTEKSVGSNDDEGEMSPRNLLATTITDQLKLATSGKSKVISISLKDRAAVLPGGHWANAAYWYDNKTGKFISSTYYIKSLPKWVEDFNGEKLADKYLSEEWKLSEPIFDYQISNPDESPYERDVFSEGKTSFPHSFTHVKPEDKYGILESTPFGNQIVEEFVKAALKNENLGKGNETDFLAISFSSTDFIGHAYGNYSYELEDTYIKLDEQIADLLNALDKQVGKGNYLLFFTADHGALDTPGYLKEHNLPTGELNYKRASDSLKSFTIRTFGDEKLIENFSNNQIFLDHNLIETMNLDIHKVEQGYADYLRDTFPDIASVFTRDDLEMQTANRTSTNLTLNGFNPARSGDIAITLQPGYLVSFMKKGTTHGAPYNYDTHVPMIFYGWHVPKQTVDTPVYIVDIAATVADLLKITEPSGCIGIPLIK
ncbi:MAG: alkaline phosphatase family protein [Bacteroidetes bacterium]|nr:alkaline phosphatase family protein [Bacteroidota bacterium]